LFQWEADFDYAVAGFTSAGVIDAIARKRGCLMPRNGDGPDRDKAARILLSDYRNGILGRTSLETPGTVPEAPRDMSSVSGAKICLVCFAP
jgi:ribosome biogenesis GTPase A